MKTVWKKVLVIFSVAVIGFVTSVAAVSYVLIHNKSHY